MKSKKYIVGSEELLEIAMSDWAQVGIDDDLIPIPIELRGDYSFDLNSIHKLNSQNTTAFVTWGNEFMNFQRLEIFMEMKKLGFKLPPLISPNAFVSKNVKLSENVYINSGVKIGPGVTIGMNTVVMSGVIFHSNVEIGNSCFIDSGTIFKEQVNIAEHCDIGSSSLIEHSINIGKFSFIDAHSNIVSDVPMNSYFLKTLNARIF